MCCMNIKNIMYTHSICWMMFFKAPYSVTRMHIFSSITPVRLWTWNSGSDGSISTSDSTAVHWTSFPPPLERLYAHHFRAGLDTTVASLGESAFSFVDSASSSLGGKIHARAAPAVPSPLWREKQRKVAQTKAQQPVKVVRTYRGTKAKFRN